MLKRRGSLPPHRSAGAPVIDTANIAQVTPKPSLSVEDLLGVAHCRKRWTFHRLADYCAQPGGMIVSITSEPTTTADPHPGSPVWPIS